jgi:hypothetical protein
VGIEKIRSRLELAGSLQSNQFGEHSRITGSVMKAQESFGKVRVSINLRIPESNRLSNAVDHLLSGIDAQVDVSRLQDHRNT